MDPLSTTASIIAVLQLSSNVVGYLTNVKDASKERAQCAIEVSNLHSLLLNLKFHLDSENVNTPWYTAVRALAIESGPLDQFKQALQTLQAGMTDRGRSKKVTDILMWKFKKGEVESILRRVERLKTLVEIALQRDQFKLSQAIKTDTQTIKDDVRTISNDNQTIKNNTSNIKDDTEAIRSGFDSVKIQLDNTNIHKAGKTMLAAIAIDHLLNNIQSDTVGVAYIYCNYKAREEQDTSHMLAAILKQLVQAQPQSSTCLETLYIQHRDKGTRPLVDDLFNTLTGVVSYFSTTYIVVDALDECRDSDGTRRQLLDKLNDLQRTQDIRLMFTSRFIPEIVDGFPKAIKLEVQASKEDVAQYLAGQLYRLPRCIQNDTLLQVAIQDTIVKAAGGIFLLARLFVDSLLDKRTKAKVKSTLTALSEGFQTPIQAYDQAYGQAIERIEGQLPGDTALAKSVLTWITNAKRPLKIIEICYAVAIEPDQESLDSDDIPDISDLVSVCAGLVSVDEESKIVRLVHYTTQEYLERTQDLWNPGAQLRVASACLTYLSLPALRNHIHMEDLLYSYWFVGNPFVKYAAMYWGDHVLPFQDELREQARLFLRDETLVNHAARARNVILYGWDQGRITKRTCLHLISQLGLHIILMDFIPGNGVASTTPIHTRDIDGQTPLSIAAQMGHENMVKIFVNNGVDVTSDLLHASLYQAASEGHESIVDLLLDSGANIDGIPCFQWTSALEVASLRGHERLVRKLLEKEADININDGGALIMAIRGRQNNIAKLLVEQGINLNNFDPEYDNALQTALQLGDDDMVRYLLERGADIHLNTSTFNPLGFAVDEGHTEVVKTLLNWGADVNSRSERYGTILMSAVRPGKECLMEILLTAGADIEARGGRENHNALQLASTSGNLLAAQVLLDRGADINAKGGDLDSAIQAASLDCYTNIVRLLIDRGADVTAQGGLYGNALNAATAREHVRDNVCGKRAVQASEPSTPPTLRTCTRIYLNNVIRFCIDIDRVD